jgi:NADH-quinone oxidoreductase subunit G
MTDTGRALYKECESDDRLVHYTIEGVHKGSDEAAVAAAELLKSGKIALVGSANSSVEEQFFYKGIAESSGAKVSLVSHYGDGDGLLQSEDLTPNLRGALVTGLISELPSENLESLARDINSGAIKTILAVNEDLTSLGISKDVLAKAKVIYVGSHANRTSEVANIVLPSLMVFEKDGSFVNQSFRIQRFKAAIPGPLGVQPDFKVLEKIASALAEEKATAVTIDSVWERMVATIDQLGDSLRWRTLPEKGITLDASSFLDLGFVETKNLKYDPTAFKEAQVAQVEV